MSLSCMTEEVVDLVQWYRDGEVVGSGPEHVIASFVAQHAGNYTCRATSNGVGTVTSAVAVLQLASKHSTCIYIYTAYCSNVQPILGTTLLE